MNNLFFRLANHSITRLVFKTPWIGVYSSYSEAMAAIPSSLEFGYDHEPMNGIYLNYPLYLVRPGDYPILLHLNQILRPGNRVIDMGGNVGMACYLAHRYGCLPEPVEWTICDVPAIVATAKQVADREGTLKNALRFATRIEETGECDLFITTGALQHLEQTLPELLEKLPRLPSSVLVNRIPVWDRPPLATLAIHFNQPLASPSMIFNRRQFVSEVEQLGYRLVDDWACPESSLSIRFHPGLRVNAYHGFYFSRTVETGRK